MCVCISDIDIRAPNQYVAHADLFNSLLNKYRT